MSKSRKKIFPKPPVRFHSKLAKELGKYSNKVCPEATLQAIYSNEQRSNKLTESQVEQLAKLKLFIQQRGDKCTKKN